jgi:hypothetical protein
LCVGIGCSHSHSAAVTHTHACCSAGCWWPTLWFAGRNRRWDRLEHMARFVGLSKNLGIRWHAGNERKSPILSCLLSVTAHAFVACKRRLFKPKGRVNWQWPCRVRHGWQRCSARGCWCFTGFDVRVAQLLAQETGLPFRPATNKHVLCFVHGWPVPPDCMSNPYTSLEGSLPEFAITQWDCGQCVPDPAGPFGSVPRPLLFLGWHATCAVVHFGNSAHPSVAMPQTSPCYPF